MSVNGTLLVPFEAKKKLWSSCPQSKVSVLYLLGLPLHRVPTGQNHTNTKEKCIITRSGQFDLFYKETIMLALGLTKHLKENKKQILLSKRNIKNQCKYKAFNTSFILAYVLVFENMYYYIYTTVGSQQVCSVIMSNYATQVVCKLRYENQI